MRNGITFAVTAYVIWGVSPIYWKLIEHVPAMEIVGHRMVWSFFFVLTVVLLRKEGHYLSAIISKRRSVLIFLSSALLLSINWLVYIWAVNSGFIVDASLGYFINPLVSVLFGVVFLNEHLRVWQWVSVTLAFLGVVYLTIRLGSLPWISLILAFTFGIYGLIRKKVTEKSIHGFTLETGFMFFPALIYLVGLEIGKGENFGHGSTLETFLLVTTGAFTAIPLVLFGTAAQLVQLSTLGFIQYIAPTLQFLIGVFMYGEDFSPEKLIGYGMIWLALLIFTLEGVVAKREQVR